MHSFELDLFITKDIPGITDETELVSVDQMGVTYQYSSPCPVGQCPCLKGILEQWINH